MHILYWPLKGIIILVIFTWALFYFLCVIAKTDSAMCANNHVKELPTRLCNLTNKTCTTIMLLIANLLLLFHLETASAILQR